MLTYFSPSTCFLYRMDVYEGALPSDAVEISEEEYAALQAGISERKILVPGPDGRPLLQEPLSAPLTFEEVHALRQTAYLRESDPIKNEAEYDALIRGADPDYAEWLAKVAEIKVRYPLPVA